MSSHYQHHPKGMGSQNAHVLDTYPDGYRAALDLIERGFTVLSVHIEGPKPVVKIAGERRCRELRGELYRRRTCDGRDERVMTINHLGSRIEWREYS
jgi:hypothetical protein